MKIRSALIAICLGWMLALAPIVIQQFTGSQPLRWRLTYREDPLVPTQRKPGVHHAPSSQATLVPSATTDLPTVTPTFAIIAKSKAQVTGQSTATADAPASIDSGSSHAPSPTNTSTSIQPVAQAVLPTATTTATPIPTATPTPSPTATPLPNRVDLQIRQSAAPDPVQAGALLTYTIQVDNPGPGIAQNVLIRNTLPNGLLFEGAASLSVRLGKEPTLLLNNNRLTGSVDWLKVGGTITIIAPVRVRPNLGLTTLLNQAIVSSTTPDEQLTNNLAAVLVTLSGRVPPNNSYLPVVHK